MTNEAESARTPSRADDRSPVTVRVRSDGAVETLHDDRLGLAELGQARVRRASHVEFDEERQRWTVTDAVTGEELFDAERRGCCLAWERAYFYRALSRGLQPFEHHD